MPAARPAAAFAALLLLVPLAGCGDDTTGDESAAPATAGDVAPGAPFPEERCEANRAAGTITYLSGFDFAATASIVEVLVADAKGYFDELCLDVEVKPSFSVQNYPIVAANAAQFSSAGSFSELVDYAIQNEVQFVATAIEGKTGIDALLVQPGTATELTDLAGTTIGVKGRLTSGVAAMLLQAGLREGEDFDTVLLDGFDPTVHMEVPGIVGFPGYKSNEPLQLEAAGIPFELFDPADYGIPGSFGVLYTNAAFVDEHPTAAQDFLRAAMRGLADAVADPAEAAGIAVDAINANGNAMFLSPDGETARWAVESRLVAESNGASPLGVPELDRLTEEVATYAAIGMFGGTAPDIAPYVSVDLIAGVYDADGSVRWPG